MKALRALKHALAPSLHYQQPPRRAMWTSLSRSMFLAVTPLRPLITLPASVSFRSKLLALIRSLPVGFLAQVIAIIEDHPFAPHISRRNPTLNYLQRAARFSKSMPDELRKAILDDKSSEELLKYLEASRDRRALVRTTTAADLISGGDKGESTCHSCGLGS